MMTVLKGSHITSLDRLLKLQQQFKKRQNLRSNKSYDSKRSNVRWYFAIAFFIIGVIAYMDRSNISYIAPQMMADLGMDKSNLGY